MENTDHNKEFGMVRLVLIVGFFILAYMLYNLTISVYENYQIEEHIAEFQERNIELAAQNSQKLEDFQYYTSKEYIEKIAKQNLGLVNPGEKVIIIPDENLVLVSTEEDSAEISAEIRASWSNKKKWWKFFFAANPYKV